MAQKLAVLNFNKDKQLLDVEDSPFDIGTSATEVTYDPRHRRVYVTNSEDNTLSVFKMKKIAEDYFKSKYVLDRFELNSQNGIYLTAEHSIFERNTIAQNQDGLFIMYRGDSGPVETTLIANYIIKNTRHGVSILGKLNNDFEETVLVRIGETEGDGNTITGNGTGISSRDARLYVFNNSIESNQEGVGVHDAGHVVLGSQVHPGNNVIRNNIHVGLKNYMNRRVNAEGNVWNPDVQGADSEGHYDPQQSKDRSNQKTETISVSPVNMVKFNFDQPWSPLTSSPYFS